MHLRVLLSLPLLVLAPGEAGRDVVGFPEGALPYRAERVGSETCGTCHAEQFRRQQEHPMALTARAVTDRNVELWFSEEKLAKTVAWRAAETPRYRLTPDGVALESGGESARVAAVLGSGSRGFTPIAAEEGRRIRELRVSFFSPHDTWLMTPGSETDREPLGAIDSVEQSQECLGCHATSLAWKNEQLDLQASLLGVQCERCHGPGSAHVDSVRAGNPSAIFNPGALRADRQVEFCGQCHRQPSDIDPLDVMSRHPSMARHAGASLMLSECFRRSPRESTITCLECHDPHDAGTTEARFRASCMRCHSAPERDYRSQTISANANCVSCHMPVEEKTFMGIGFTDHWIRVPGSPAPVDSFEREEYLESLESSYRAGAQRVSAPEKRAKLGVGLAEIQFARKSYDAAFATLKDALSASPNYSQRLRAASLYRQSGQFPEAGSTLQAAIAGEPSVEEGHLQLGEVLQQQGKLDEAESSYRRALEIDPDSAAAHNSLGSVFGSQGKLQEALEEFQRALELRPDYLEANSNLGLALQRLGRFDEARLRFEEALRSRPDWPVAQNALARILATHPEAGRRDPELAVRLADRAAEQTGYENPRILDTLAAAYASAGNYEKAISVAEEAVRLASDEALAGQIRARLRLYQEGRPYVEPSPP